MAAPLRRPGEFRRPPGGALQTVRDLVFDRCPNCHEGYIWAGLMRMEERCPVCRVRFEREPGYFLGAIYFSWVISNLVAAPVWLSIVFVLELGWTVAVLAVAVEMVVLYPFLFRYSRNLWLYFDFRVDPPDAFEDF